MKVEKRWWWVGHNKTDETGAEAAAKLAAGINGEIIGWYRLAVRVRCGDATGGRW